MSMAGVHAGLKGAVDANDMKKASAIINNFKVTDIYCPASLSPANAEKLYGSRFADDPSLLKECDKEFVAAYSEGACGDKKKAKICKVVLSKTPMNQWGKYLQEIKSKGLDKTGEGGSNPFSNYFAIFVQSNSMKAYNLLDFTAEDEASLALVKEISGGNGASSVTSLMEAYGKQSYISDSVLVGSCRLVPNIDKQMNSAAGFEVFSCAEALARYNPSATPACEEASEGVIHTTTPLMDGAPAYNFVCKSGKWKPASSKEMEEFQALLAEMNKPKPLDVSVQSDPAGAAVFVDGADSKKVTPCVLPLLPGEHNVSLSLYGYGSKELPVSVTDEPVSVEESLEYILVPASFVSVPESATVFVDGREICGTPCTGNVLPGSRKVSFALKGYDTKDTVMELQSGSEVNATLLQHIEVPPPQAPVTVVDTGWTDPDDNKTDKAAAAPAKEATTRSVRWLSVGISAVALAGGVVLAVLENNNAKTISERKIKSVRELDKAKKDIEDAQSLRTVGVSIAVLGGIGIGLSFAF